MSSSPGNSEASGAQPPSDALERLRTNENVDLAKVDLTFEGFRALAQNPHLTANERIGFPNSYRTGFEDAIFHDILSKLPILTGEGATVLDIGPGCAGLSYRIIELCRERKHHLILVDSEEMLAQLPDIPGVTTKIAGAFPQVAREVGLICPSVDAILCYSVFHYVYVDGNPFDFLDRALDLVGSGGRLLIGDIPNVSKRRRFFATETGRHFHQNFTQTDTYPELHYNQTSPGKIDDAVLMGLMQRAQSAGADAYLMPQAAGLPMANRRDDLLLMKA